MLSARDPISTLSLPPVISVDTWRKIAQAGHISFSCMNQADAWRNLVVFGQEVHLRHGMTWDRLGWDGESLTSGRMAVGYFIFGVGLLCVLLRAPLP